MNFHVHTRQTWANTHQAHCTWWVVWDTMLWCDLAAWIVSVIATTDHLCCRITHEHAYDTIHWQVCLYAQPSVVLCFFHTVCKPTVHMKIAWLRKKQEKPEWALERGDTIAQALHTHTRTHIRTHTHAHIHIYAIHTHMNTHIHMHTRIYIHIHIHIHIYMHAYTYTYTYCDIHACTYTYIRWHSDLGQVGILWTLWHVSKDNTKFTTIYYDCILVLLLVYYLLMYRRVWICDSEENLRYEHAKTCPFYAYVSNRLGWFDSITRADNKLEAELHGHRAWKPTPFNPEASNSQRRLPRRLREIWLRGPPGTPSPCKSGTDRFFGLIGRQSCPYR